LREADALTDFEIVIEENCGKPGAADIAAAWFEPAAPGSLTEADAVAASSSSVIQAADGRRRSPLFPIARHGALRATAIWGDSVEEVYF